MICLSPSISCQSLADAFSMLLEFISVRMALSAFSVICSAVIERLSGKESQTLHHELQSVKLEAEFYWTWNPQFEKSLFTDILTLRHAWGNHDSNTGEIPRQEQFVSSKFDPYGLTYGLWSCAKSFQIKKIGTTKCWKVKSKKKQRKKQNECCDN